MAPTSVARSEDTVGHRSTNAVTSVAAGPDFGTLRKLVSSSPSAPTMTMKSRCNCRTSAEDMTGARDCSIRWPAGAPLSRPLTKGYAAIAVAKEQHAPAVDRHDPCHDDQEGHPIKPTDVGDLAVVRLGRRYPVKEIR